MIYVWYALNYLLMITMPVALAWFINRKRKPGWALFGIGAATFVASQLGHLPFNWLVLERLELVSTDTAVLSSLVILALFLGLSAGVFEEGARYLMYRYWARDARTWGKGLMLGAGHGGIESILLGLGGGLTVAVLAAIRNGALTGLVSEAEIPLVEEQISTLFSYPWHFILLGAVERLFALCAHLAMSLLVLQVFIRGQRRWLFASILWHTLLNALAVFAVATWNEYVTEAIVGVMALLSLGIIWALRSPEPEEPELAPLPEPGPTQLSEAAVTAEMLERSRYN
jgi:uncharacterized membrane protein YhfC